MTQPNRVNGYTLEERRRGCSSKRRYSDELSARAGGMCSLENNQNGYDKLWTYHCDICGGYHLTRKRKPDQEPITLIEQVA